MKIKTRTLNVFGIQNNMLGIEQKNNCLYITLTNSTLVITALDEKQAESIGSKLLYCEDVKSVNLPEYFELETF